jgi:hypothetical protein
VFYRSPVAHDDWRLRIELDEDAAGGLLGRLGLPGSDARELAHELEHERLAVTRDGSTIFVYADSSLQLEQARKVIDAEVADLGIEAVAIVAEHWLGDEDRWDDEPVPDTLEDRALAAGYAPWEVRIECDSHDQARELAEQLESEGYGVVRRWSYVIAGTATEADARELARRLHGEAVPGGELVWEVAPGNPFAVFGGLGGGGTPI